MIIVLRIRGQAGIKKKSEGTLRRLSIYRKLSCTLINKDDAVRMGMVKSVDNYISFGEIDDELAKKLIEKRGETIGGKKVKDAGKVLEEIKKGEWKIKKFFRLHPPIKGFKKSTKLRYPQGILGENKDIGKLIERML